MPIQQSYLDWNEPLLPAVTQKLLSSHTAKWIDLSQTLVIVPTVQSGRRLRESLALAAADNQRGLLPPEILTPDALLSRQINNMDIANDACVTAAWVSVLEEIVPEKFRALFPSAPPRTTGWLIGMAQSLTQLRNQLGEEGLSISSAAERAVQIGQEAERWRQLARLEGLYLDQLQLRKLIDPKEARHQAAHDYQAPESIQRIILVATPDPQPLPLRALDKAAATVLTEVWIYGPNEPIFDQWGRPIIDKWMHRPLLLEEWNCLLQPLPNYKSTAQTITQKIQSAQPESVLVGLTATELNPIVAENLHNAGIASYNPDGHALHTEATGRLAELLCLLADKPDTTNVRTLLQHPDIIQWLDCNTTQEDLLHALDICFEKHLCPDLNSLILNSSHHLKVALLKIKELGALLKQQSFATALAEALHTIYGKQTVPSGQAGTQWSEHAKAIRQLLDMARLADTHFPQLPSSFARNVFKQALKTTRVYPDRPRDAHDLLGWLELLWNDAPHLIIAGVNEGNVPESVIGDAFLPEGLREQLGLRTNAQRFARDAYLIEALCRRRAKTGRIDILVPQSANDGSPLKPSRLLFQGSKDTLLPRTRTLFTAHAKESAHSRHTVAWKLSPPAGLKMPNALSVSALKSYLECPFRFFLRHIMKMRTLDITSRELTPASFGIVLHATVAHLQGLTFDHRTKQEDLVKKLHKLAEAEITHKYGTNLSFALRLQQEALMARLLAFCDRQVADVRENGGLKIMQTEAPFEMQIEGITVRGVIDRIDERNGRIELIDYKTADSPKTPQQAHLAAVARKVPPAHLPKAAFFAHNHKTYRWTDLQ